VVEINFGSKQNKCGRGELKIFF